MKLKHLLLTALMTVVGIGSSWADTDQLSTGKGWTKVTDLGSMTLNDYYFAFVDDSRDLMLSLGDGNQQSSDPAYRTFVYLPCENAEMNPNMLWTLEAFEGGYNIKNAEYQSYFLQTEWNAAWYCRTHDNGGGDKSWGKWNLTLNDGTYLIENGKYTGNWIGPWDDGQFTNGMEVAGNKNENNRGSFHIYAIAKAKVDWVNKASLQNPANFTYKITNPDFEKKSALNGWTNSGTVNFGEQSNNSFTGKSGRRYVENYHGNGTLDIHQTLKNLPAGTYKLVAQAQTSGSDGLLYANNHETSVTSNNSYEVTFTLSEIGDVKIGFKATSNGSAWTGVDNFRLYFYGDISNLTSLIVNNSFEEDLTGWTNDGTAKVVAQGNTSFGKTGGKYAELWQPNGIVNVHQVVDNLPAGVYKVSARVKARGLSSAKIFANSSEYNLKIEDNEYEYDVYEKLATAGSIDLGINAVGTGAGSSWIAFDNFRLMYVGEDFPQVELATDLVYNKHLETAQSSAKDAFDSNPNGTTYTAFVYSTVPVKEEKAYEEAQVARTTAALQSSTIATNVLDGWRCTNIQKFQVNTWSGEGATDGSNMTTPFIENWVAAGGLLGDGEISYLMVGLTPGAKYSFSALGRAIIEKNAEATLKGIKMFANETEIDLTEQGEAKSAGENSLVYGTFTLTGTVNSDGVLAIGFKINDTNCNWLAFKNVKFGELPSEADKTALAEAIAAADGKTYGFQDGEYAPYKNAAAIAALEAAKAVDVEHAMKAEIVNATTALISAVWTVNVGEVNAVANGDFEGSYSVLEGSGVSADRAIYVPEGWTINYTNRETNDMTSLNSSTTQWNQFKDLPQPSNGGNNTYWIRFRWGSNESLVYSQVIPNLPAGTYYLSADVYVNGNTATAKISVEGEEVKVDQTSWTNYMIKFVLAEKKDVTVKFSYVQGGSAADSRAGFDNFVLKTVPVTELAGTTVTVANKYGTFISEIDREIPTGMKAYSCAAVVESVLTLTEATELKANTPYILENTTESNITIDAENGQSLKVADSYTSGLLTGVYTDTSAPVSSYVLQNNEKVGFYQVVEEKPITVPANRAYLTVPASQAPAFFFDTETAIQTVEALTTGVAEIYNANGVKQQSLQEGINIVKLANGKTQKVLVK